MIADIVTLHLNPLEIQAIWLSVKVAMISTILGLPAGLAIGWFLARKNFPGKGIIEGIIHLPMVLPPVSTGYLLLIIFGTNGIIGSYLTKWFGIHLAFNFAAVVIASIVVSLPLMIRSIRTAIEMVDPALENTARTLGASPFKTMLRVTIPLSLPGILSGSVLCFARSLGEFGATITFAGNIPGKTQTIALAIYSHMQIPNHEKITWRLVIVSVILSLVAMIISEYLGRKRFKPQT